MATDTVMQNDPNDAFAKMTDEEIVLESQQHDNVLAHPGVRFGSITIFLP